MVRATAMDPVAGTAKAQYAYQRPKIPVDAPAGARFGPDNGLSEFLAIGNRKFIAVVRAFADGIGNTIRLVLAEITDATADVSRVAMLTDTPYTPMTRKLFGGARSGTPNPRRTLPHVVSNFLSVDGRGSR